MYCPIMESLVDDIEEYELDLEISCTCIGSCGRDCECYNRYGFAYSETGKIIENFNDTKPIFECNNNCSCTVECYNRVVQKGSKCKISIRKTINKGLGVFAEENIEKGEFIGIYAGVIVDNNCEGPYVFLIRENTPLKTYTTAFDAQYSGNFSRFINHGCNPNLQALAIRVNHIIPTVAFFSIKPIAKGKELTFEYRKYSNEQQCFCGSKKCKGTF
ncbi:unnamed protein product [Blepharisma stoltei]|uniref:Histone-lysine N-methyltransferase SETMAR n=1 Tax=Blepharisma stoltei TaxID=1481888 RepID=A0AAU9IZR7_9CILI|nr:unnamed protein product [Blepharisma stoltei]